MTTVCAWCKAVIFDDGRVDGLLSHGCCVDCLAKQLAKLEQGGTKT